MSTNMLASNTTRVCALLCTYFVVVGCLCEHAKEARVISDNVYA